MYITHVTVQPITDLSGHVSHMQAETTEADIHSEGRLPKCWKVKPRSLMHARSKLLTGQMCRQFDGQKIEDVRTSKSRGRHKLKVPILRVRK